MTDEEKKAYDNLIMLKYFTMEKEDKESIDIILKLIDKQEQEINKLNNVIDRMAEKIKEDTEWFYSDFDNKSKEEIKEYFMEEKE